MKAAWFSDCCVTQRQSLSTVLPKKWEDNVCVGAAMERSADCVADSVPATEFSFSFAEIMLVMLIPAHKSWCVLARSLSGIQATMRKLFSIDLSKLVAATFIFLSGLATAQTVKYIAFDQESSSACYIQTNLIRPSARLLCDAISAGLSKYTKCGYQASYPNSTWTTSIESSSFNEPAYDPNSALSYVPYPFGGCFATINVFRDGQFSGSIYYDGGGGGRTMFRAGSIDRYHDKPLQCPPAFGNPIYPLTGSKGLREDLGIWSTGFQRLVVGYDTRRKVPGNDTSLAFSTAPAASFGELWSSNLHKRLIFQADTRGIQRDIQASRGAGGWVSFSRDGSGNYTSDADVADRLVSTSGGWRYIDAAARSEEMYDAQGKLLSVSFAGGTSLTYIYSGGGTPASVAPAAGLLIAVQDQHSRSVLFQYEQPSGVSVPRIKQVTDLAAQPIAVAYDAHGNLRQLTWPDTKSRQFLYERSDLTWAVTGIIDKNASRLATYGYDAQGRANDTQRAGGADHYSASYTTLHGWNIVETIDSTAGVVWRDHYWQTPQGTTVTKPNGSTSSMTATSVLGMPRVTSQSQPAGSGCAASSSALSYDVNGNVEIEDDFNGNRVCKSHDLARNLESVTVQGLATTQTCSAVTAADATLPSGSRKVSKQWHPDWRLETKVAEPGRITTSVYNGQPDPFAGNAIASCAPSAALLPDGKPIVVLCKSVEQATTDADGSLGFGAPLQAGVAVREQKWSYNQVGQMLTHDGPRTDVSDLTTYTYYTDTVFSGAAPDVVGHNVGDLKSTTNAAGKLTDYTKYNLHGQLLQSSDPNGVLTVNTYDLRQRLLSTSVGGQTTSYIYDAARQLTRMTRPDGSWIGYEYDAARRQKAVLDNKGNRIEYTLDNAGNKTAHNVKDPGGALRRTLARSIDALGRVQQTVGRE